MKHLPFILLIVVAVAIAAATLVESVQGTALAHRLFYGANWFRALWGVLTICAIWHMTRRRLWKRPLLLLLHGSFVVILAGALVTSLWGQTGTLHLRQGIPQDTFTDEQSTEVRLPFLVRLDHFQTIYDPDGRSPRDYQSHVTIAQGARGRQQHVIRLNQPLCIDGYRLYQSSYDTDGLGTVLSINHDPWGIRLTYLGYALLAFSMLLLALRRPHSNTHYPSPNTQYPRISEQTPNTLAQRVAQRLLAVLFASYMVLALLGKPLMPVLRSPMLVVHVGVIMISYCLLIVSFFNRRVLRLAVFMLAAGIFLGAVWANLSWGTYWSWDPKESWALVTLIIYALPLHTESLPWFRSQRHYRWYSLLAILSLLMTYFGVNYLLGGMHSYT